MRNYRINQPRSCIRDRHPVRGFALVIALALMGFIVLLLLSLTTLVNVDMTVATSQSSQDEARANALLGVEIALGKLQSVAGPDGRVTSQAGVLPNTDLNAMRWTGVWNAEADASDPPLGWLVSGEAPDPTVDPTSSPDFSWAVKPSAAEASVGVAVPLELIATGGVGYWVSGQNAKANLGVPPVLSDAEFGIHSGSYQGLDNRNFDYDGSDSFRTELWKQVIPYRTAIELIDPAIASVAYDQEVVSALSIDSNLNASKLALHFDLPDSAIHNYAASNLSLLTDVPRGRLKMDLSDEEGFNLSPGLPSITHNKLNDNWRYQYFLRNMSETTLTLTEGLDPEHQSAFYPDFAREGSNVVYGALPILTEFLIQFAVFSDGDPGDETIRIGYNIQAEFWNPYNAHISHNIGLPFVLVIEGLPQITIEGETIDLDFVVNSLDPDPNLDPPQTVFLGSEYTTDQTPQMVYAIEEAAFNPGEVKRVGLTTQTGFSSSNYEALLLSSSISTYRIVDTGIAAPASTMLSLSVSEANSGSQPWPNQPPFSFDDRNYNWNPGTDSDRFQVTLNVKHGANLYPVNLYQPTSTYSAVSSFTTPAGSQSPIFGYGFEIRDNLVDLIAAGDPRRRPYTEDQLEPLIGASGSGSNSNWDQNPLFNTGDIREDNVMDEYFYAGGPGFVLFEPMRDRAISVGQMQHAIGDHASMIGSADIPSNPQMTDGNWLFDSAYFSTIPRAQNPTASYSGDEISQWTFPNPNIRLYWDSLNPLPVENLNAATTNSTGLMHTELAAQNLLLEGGFNINSISSEAWKLLLAGLNIPNASTETTQPVDTIGGGNVTLERSFSRFPYTISNRASLKSDSELRSLSADDLADEAFLPQIRSLSKTELTELADGVVEATKTRGEPWMSVEEWVNAGVLADLLDPNGGNQSGYVNQPVTSINASFSDFSGAPIYLAQQDILSQIAPQLTVRSDTFLIRGVGDSRDPLSGEILGQARCEAIVQRLPTPVELSAPLVANDQIHTLSSADHPFGRRFVIVSFRWLSDQEI